MNQARGRGLLCALLLAGCIDLGDDPRVDVTGTYRVDTYLESACAQDQPSIGSFDRIEVAPSGADIVLRTCYLGLSTCLPDEGERLRAEPTIGTWTADVVTAKAGPVSEGQRCFLSRTTSRVDISAAHLRRETTDYSVVELDVSSCTEARARELAPQMPCVKHAIVDATAVR
ncbi:MAG: hypothetical protein HOV81_26800 [Kofleriaceae bacterium]|nr:hypothetical protein [Kofleriaceae bacterium]